MQTAHADVVWKVDSLESIGGHPVSPTGAPVVVTEGAERHVHFAGVSDGLVVSGNPLEGWAAFTVEVLFRPDADGPAAQRFIHLDDDQNRRMTFETRITPEGWALDTFLLDGRNRCPLLDMKRLHPAGRWVWAAIVYEGAAGGGHMTSYVNGTRELAGTVALAPMKGGRLGIGFRMNRVYWFKGDIRELRFHPRALAADELARIQPEPGPEAAQEPVQEPAQAPGPGN